MNKDDDDDASYVLQLYLILGLGAILNLTFVSSLVLYKNSSTYMFDEHLLFFENVMILSLWILLKQSVFLVPWQFRSSGVCNLKAFLPIKFTQWR
jgi:hypothetical protein